MIEPCDVARFLVCFYPQTAIDRLFDPIDATAREIALIASDSEYMQLRMGKSEKSRMIGPINNNAGAYFKPKYPVFALGYEMLSPIIHSGMWRGQYVVIRE